MKDYELLDAIGGIDEKYVDGAMREGKRINWIKWGALAACICLIAAAVLAVGLLNRPAPLAEPNPQSGSTTEPVSKPTQSGVPESGDNDISASSASSNVSSYDEDYENAKIKIPAITLPEKSDLNADMIGLVVYRGNIYTQSGISYYRDEAWKMDSIIGEYLGHAKGTIDEWSSQDEYATEFASTYEGEIYAVKGYDTSFRLCLRSEYKDDDGKTQLWIEVMDRLNGIGISTGKDLFEDRLHLKGRIVKVEWQTHDDWNYNRGNIHKTDIEPSVLDSFIDSLCEAEFIDIDNHKEELPDSVAYNTSDSIRLMLTMEDGMTVNLQLYEGGYVGYAPLAANWHYAQKIPDGIFNAIYDSCI